MNANNVATNHFSISLKVHEHISIYFLRIHKHTEQLLDSSLSFKGKTSREGNSKVFLCNQF